MQKFLKTTIKLIPLASTLFFVGCGNPENKSVAKIGDETITFKDLYNQLQTKPSVNVAVQNKVVNLPIAGTLGFQGFEDLLNQKLVLLVAKQDGISITDKEVDKEIEFRKKLNPRYIQDLIGKGMSTEQIKSHVKVDIANEKLMTKGVTVTRQEIDDYIKNHPKEFIFPATADIVWMLVDDSTKQKADQELSSGQKFEDVAIRYSKDPSAKERKARFAQNIIEALPPVLKDTFAKTGVGKPTAWINTGNGWARFYVNKTTPAQPIPIDETRRELVRRDIAMQRGRLANDLGKRLLEKLKTIKVSVDYAPFKERWKKMEEQLKSIQKLNTNNTVTNNSKEDSKALEANQKSK